jgi:molecular chaperone GrpE (heat shock protein)
MAETTLNEMLEKPEEFKTAVSEGNKRLAHIHEQMERDQQEIDWLRKETQKSIDRTKEFLKLK